VRLVLAAVAVAAGSLTLLPRAPAADRPVAATPATATPVDAAPVAAAPAAVVAEQRATTGAPPVRVRVPAIGVDSGLARLGVDASGALVPPADFTQVGWFAAGPAPGDVGPAVLAGHVDSRTGPAVFYRLREVAVGDEVLVDRGDGTTARFTVTAVGRYPKTAFPTAEVYGPTPDAELRLITCGGDFDRETRSYRDNVVVYARQAT
jgi:Sortase domain